LQPFFKYYASKAEADKKKHDDESADEHYLRLYWTVFKKVCSGHTYIHHLKAIFT